MYASHGTDSTYDIIVITPGNYSGPTVVAELNNLFNTTPGSFYIQATFNVGLNQLSIRTDSDQTGFQIFPDFQLKYMYTHGGWNGPSYNPNNLNSVNDFIQNTNNFTIAYSKYQPYYTSFMNFNGLRNIYICSPNLSSLSVLGPNGAPANIIKKVPVTSDYGYNIFAGGSIAHDYIECSKQTSKTLEFQFQDVFGKNINLNNNPVSFSIILSTINEDMK